MPASSLVDQCKRVAIKNIASLNDVGAFEYFQIKDILSHVKTTSQLRQIEVNSPQIQGENAELWQKFIAKEIPDWHKKNYSPKNPVKWYEVYLKYKREQDAEIKRDEEILRESMLGLKKARDNNVSKVVDLRQLPKIPRDPRMLANNGGVPLGKKGFKKDNPSSLVFSAGSKTKVTNGQSVLLKARREAKEISAMSKLSRPTHQLGSIGRVAKAPAAMVKEYQTAAQPIGKPISSVKILTRRPNLSGTFQPGSSIDKSSLEERENRLRALTTAGAKRDFGGDVKANVVDFSDDEDIPDDLFDEHSASSSPPKPSRTNLASSVSSSSSRSIAKPQSVTKKMSVLHQLALPRKNAVYKREPRSPTPPELKKSPIVSSPPARLNTPPVGPNIGKPSPSASAPKPVMKKRQQVDIFNRGPKKPRLF